MHATRGGFFRQVSVDVLDNQPLAVDLLPKYGAHGLDGDTDHVWIDDTGLYKWILWEASACPCTVTRLVSCSTGLFQYADWREGGREGLTVVVEWLDLNPTRCACSPSARASAAQDHRLHGKARTTCRQSMFEEISRGSRFLGISHKHGSGNSGGKNSYPDLTRLTSFWESLRSQRNPLASHLGSLDLNPTSSVTVNL